MSTQAIQRLPYIPPREGYDRWAFDNPLTRAVSKKTRIAFSDYGLSMHVVRRSQTNNMRRTANGLVPLWTVDDKKVSEVVLQFCEARFYLPIPSPETTSEERLARINAAEKIRLKQDENNLEFFLEHQEGTNAQHIQNFDTQIMVLRRHSTPALIATILYLKYRCFENSVDIAEAVHLKPPHVRIILYRANILARAIEMGARRLSRNGRALNPYKVGRPRVWTPEKMDVMKYWRSVGAPWEFVASEMGKSVYTVMAAWRNQKMSASVTL